MATTNNDDLVCKDCDKSLSILTAKYWEAHDNPAAGDEVWVLKKQVQDATIEWAKAKARLLTPDTVTSELQVKQARALLQQMQAAQAATDVIVAAARFIAFVAAI